MTYLAILLFALVLYTYLGYPLLVALLARLWPKPSAPAEFEPSVSVCIPVHDGAAYLPAKLASIDALEYPKEKLQVLVYSDGSRDDSARVARRSELVTVIESSRRLGKPTAVNRLAQAAWGDVLVLTDVRQPLSPGAVRALVRQLADPSVGCVSGNLELAGATGAGMYWRYERFIRSSESKLGSMVGVSGALYAVRRTEIPVLPADVILDDMYVPLRIALGGKRIVFEDTARAYDEAADDEREFPRKVRTLAGNFQLVALMPELLLPWRTRAWLPLVSHKLARLACPWALVGLLLLSAVLSFAAGAPGWALGFWRTLLLAQLAFYVLAALGGRAGRLGGLARTFVVLNAAAVAGLWRFVRGRQAVTW
ncbi:MAG: glycosyltransferase family 2 protein [Myxococcales bacterium]|nr:glycosyltransferase family 2 protein [Myxococcales bacterium]MCB9583152.1 glycosyltransferase family 2 protein [Polyangiaceae bacterium]